MSLNKFTDIGTKKQWMDINCNELKADSIIADTLIANGVDLAPTNGSGTVGYILATDGMGNVEWVPDSGGIGSVSYTGVGPTQVDEVVLYNGITGTTVKQSGLLVSKIMNTTGSTMTGDLNMGANNINLTTGLVDGVDVSTLPGQISAKLPLAGGTMTGNLTMTGSRIVSDNGTGAAPSYGFSSAPSTGLYLAGPSFPVVMGLSSLGVTTLYISSNQLSATVPLAINNITDYNPGNGTVINSVVIKTNSIDTLLAANLTIGANNASQVRLGNITNVTQLDSKLTYCNSNLQMVGVFENSGGFTQHGCMYFSNNLTVTNITAAGAYSTVAGTYILGNTRNFNLSLGNRLLYNGAVAGRFFVSVFISAIRDGVGLGFSSTVAISKNGNIESQSLTYQQLDDSTDFPTNYGCQAIVDLTAGNYLEVSITNNDNADDIVVRNLNMTVTQI